MNIFKSKKVLMSILIFFIIVLISIGLFICFNIVNKKDEISTEPISMNETFTNELSNKILLIKLIIKILLLQIKKLTTLITLKKIILLHIT